MTKLDYLPLMFRPHIEYGYGEGGVDENIRCVSCRCVSSQDHGTRPSQMLQHMRTNAAKADQLIPSSDSRDKVSLLTQLHYSFKAEVAYEVRLCSLMDVGKYFSVF